MDSGENLVLPDNDTPASVPSGTPQNKPKKSRKKQLFFTFVVAAILLGAAAYVFGWYIPNRPENVWRTGLDRTGQALEEIALQDPKKSLYADGTFAFDGTLDITNAGTNFIGSVSGVYGRQRSETGVVFNVEDVASGKNLDISLDVLTDLKDGAAIPDTYLRGSGFSELGLDTFLPGLSALDGQWIHISKDYLKQSLPENMFDQEAQQKITEEESRDISKRLVSGLREYVFTSETEHAVLNMEAYVGEETLNNGITAKHYKATINRKNAAIYCEKTAEMIFSHAAFKKMSNQNDEQAADIKQKFINACHKMADQGGESKPFDLWIDSKYKLIHKVKIADENNPGTYIEFGQSWTGGDEIPFFVNLRSAKEMYTSLDFTINKETQVMSGVLFLVPLDGADFSLDATFEVKPHTGEVDIDLPDNPTPIEQVLQNLGLPSTPPVVPDAENLQFREF